MLFRSLPLFFCPCADILLLWLTPVGRRLTALCLTQGKKLPSNIDEDAEEGDVSDEDSADEMEDDCKLMNGDVGLSSSFPSFVSSSAPLL